ncbi:sterol desaturase family protein [Paenibacillus hamazuiensis]|uniref:sterol desaturase family protein n=1 Tax=Paenibacillus hamazuiensis TaxID=2936508 RepID=UPI00200DE1DE|nr:sterol desaturase family protein [Paenibacillus hamazuiensis]
MTKYVKEFMSQRLILFLCAVVMVSGCGAAVTYSGARAAAAVCAGALFFIIVEYVVHRYILHEFPRIAPFAYKGHVAHHQAPSDIKYLFGPVSIDMVSYVIVLLATWLLTGYNWNMTWSVLFGASGFQLYYQWKHYVSHRPITPLTPWGKWLKKKHLLHHHKDETTWYGVSNPVLDIVMGTNRPKETKPRGSDKNMTL